MENGLMAKTENVKIWWRLNLVCSLPSRNLTFVIAVKNHAGAVIKVSTLSSFA